MTKAQADKPEQADDLGERIDALLDAMQSACDRATRQLNGEPETLEEMLVGAEQDADEPEIVERTQGDTPEELAPEATQKDVSEQPEAGAPEPEIMVPSAEDAAFADDFGAVLFEEASPEQLGLDQPVPDTPEEPAEQAPEPVPEESSDQTAAEEEDPTESAVLDEQVGKMVDEAMVSAEGDEPAESSPEGAIEDLDDELAALAEDLMNGDAPFGPAESEQHPEAQRAPSDQDEQGITSGEPEPQPEPAEAAPAEPEPVADDSPPAEPEAVAREVPAPVAPAPRRLLVEWPEWKPVRATGWKKVPAMAWRATRLYAPPLATLAWIGLGKAARAAEPWAIRVLEASARPLKGKPAEVRQAVGWSALVTLFTALVAWAFVLTRHPPKVETDQTPIGLEQPADAPTDAPADAE